MLTSSEFNPMFPAAYDVAWTLTAMVIAALAVAALVSLARAARGMTVLVSLGWVLVVLLLPVFGPLAWLLVGRRSAQAAAPARA